jgi:hypothetical protein
MSFLLTAGSFVVTRDLILHMYENLNARQTSHMFIEVA